MGTGAKRGYLSGADPPTVAARPGETGPQALEPPVFDVICPTCSRRELISARQVLGARNSEAGIHVAYRCSRGHVGELLTGRRAAEAPAGAAA